MANTINWGQAAVENTIDYGQGATDNTISWGKSQTLSPSGETNITGAGGTPAFTNTLSTTFDGIDDSVNVGLLSDLNGTQYFTMSMWVKPSALTASTDFMLFSTYTTSTNKLFFQFFGNKFAVTIANGTSYLMLFPTTFLTGQWYHITVVYDGTQVGVNKLKCYFDGVSQTNTQVNFPSSLGTFINDCRIGSYDPYLSYYSFNGNIDEFAFFNTALSQTNITSIYNSGTPTDISAISGLVSWWRMGDGSTYPTINDLGSGSNDGTMVNMSAANFVTDVPT